jgi:ABC-2 type transport system permease protein
VEPNEKEIEMKQLLTFVKKEFLHVFRDPKTLLLLFGLPIAQIILFGFALTNEIKDARIIISDLASDEHSQRIIEKFRASRHFIVEESILDPTQIEGLFQAGNIKMAILFPTGFGKDLVHDNHSEIQIIADATDPNTATALANFAQAIIMDYQKGLMNGASQPLQIELVTRNIYNPKLEGVTNFVPGVMALVLLLVCVLMTSVSIVREKEMGTMEVLLVSPFNPFMVIVAKVVPYLFLSIINLGVILLLSVYLLDMPINGSIILLFAVSILLIITALSLGVLISTSTSSQQEAMFFSLLGMMLPTMIFTGFLFPIENMPVFLQVISNIVPSKWYYIIVKDVMIKGLGITAIWKESLILIGMTLLLMGISLKKFKTRLA